MDQANRQVKTLKQEIAELKRKIVELDEAERAAS